ncbi:uncharacterized protein LOC120343426 [Styela clava]
MLFSLVLLMLLSASSLSQQQDRRIASLLCPNRGYRELVLEARLAFSFSTRSERTRKWRRKNVFPYGKATPPPWVIYEQIVGSLAMNFSYENLGLNTKMYRLKANLEEISKHCIFKSSTNFNDGFSCPLPSDVSHNGKCFRAILHDTDDVLYAAASNLCSQIGWQLANIYDGAHYVKVAKYLRDEFPTPEVQYTTAWLGMTYDTQMQILRYSTGEPTANAAMALVPTTFSSNSSFTQMAINIDWLSSKKSFVHNSPQRGALRRGALCEYNPE